MIYLDGFSGYGGFRLGFERAGWKFDKVYFSEIDKYAIANGVVKEISDTQKYHMAGNGVSIPVVQSIADKLKQ